MWSFHILFFSLQDCKERTCIVKIKILEARHLSSLKPHKEIFHQPHVRVELYGEFSEDRKMWNTNDNLTNNEQLNGFHPIWNKTPSCGKQRHGFPGVYSDWGKNKQLIEHSWVNLTLCRPISLVTAQPLHSSRLNCPISGMEFGLWLFVMKEMWSIRLLFSWLIFLCCLVNKFCLKKTTAKQDWR